jgi:hypothetical protein
MRRPFEEVGPVDACPNDRVWCYVFSGAAAIATAIGATETGAALAGIAATTAGTIGGTALASAGAGALYGGVTGGNVGQDALYGGLAGAALTTGATALGYTGADMAGGLGLDAAGAAGSASADAIASSLGTTVDANGIIESGQFVGMSASDPEVIAASNGTSAASASGLENASAALTNSGQGGGALGQTAAAAAGKGGINNTALALGALSALSSLNKPKATPVPGPASTAATQGPLFNAPLTGTGVINRTAVNPYAGQPPNSWYTYGQGPEQSFFTGNQLTFAKGGPLTKSSYVQGDGDGQQDQIPASLSDGEFVFDATTVSRAGNGSNRKGALWLEKLRHELAKDAGSTRVVQKNIKKSPADYIQEIGR